MRRSWQASYAVYMCHFLRNYQTVHKQAGVLPNQRWKQLGLVTCTVLYSIMIAP